MQRSFIRLLLGVVVILQFFASGAAFFVERHLSSGPEIVVTSANPQSEHEGQRARRVAEISLLLFMLASLLATMAFWSKVEFEWHRDDSGRGIQKQPQSTQSQPVASPKRTFGHPVIFLIQNGCLLTTLLLPFAQ